jgi:hypothetical protein
MSLREREGEGKDEKRRKEGKIRSASEEEGRSERGKMWRGQGRRGEKRER